MAAAAALAVGLGVLKRVVERHHAAQDEPTADAVSALSFTDAQTAAREALARSVAGGNPLSQNQLQAQFRLSRAEARGVRQLVLAQSNGHAPEGDS